MLQSGLPMNSENLLEKKNEISRSHVGVVKVCVGLQNTHRCLCKHHLVVYLLPQGIHLLGQGQAEQGCAIRQGSLGCDSPGSAVSSHVRAGTSSMQEDAWLSHLT